MKGKWEEIENAQASNPYLKDVDGMLLPDRSWVRLTLL